MNRFSRNFHTQGDSGQTGFLGFWAWLTHSGSLLPCWRAGSPACKTRSCATPSWRGSMCLCSILFNFLFCYCCCILNCLFSLCLIFALHLLGQVRKSAFQMMSCVEMASFILSTKDLQPPLTLCPSSWTHSHLPRAHTFPYFTFYLDGILANRTELSTVAIPPHSASWRLNTLSLKLFSFGLLDNFLLWPFLSWTVLCSFPNLWTLLLAHILKN